MAFHMKNSVSRSYSVIKRYYFDAKKCCVCFFIGYFRKTLEAYCFYNCSVNGTNFIVYMQTSQTNLSKK